METDSIFHFHNLLAHLRSFCNHRPLGIPLAPLHSDEISVNTLIVDRLAMTLATFQKHKKHLKQSLRN